MKNSRGTDVLPWILVALSAVIMGVAVSVYSSDASATDNTAGNGTANAAPIKADSTSATQARLPQL